MSIASSIPHTFTRERRQPWLRSVPAPAGPATPSAPSDDNVSHADGIPTDVVDTKVPAVVAAPKVPTCHGTFVEYANLDHGASTPALASVVAAVDKATQTYSSVHRGQGWTSQVSSHYYEAARDEVARFVGAREGDEVVFTRNTTDSFNLLARSLPRRTQVIVFATEHHATLLPWEARKTTRLPVPLTHKDAEALLTDALKRATSSSVLVVLSGASNVTGEYWPIERLAAIARKRGARVALDAAQLAGHRRIDLDTLGVDYVAFSGHKIYAPYGAGVLVGRADWLDAAPPYLAGGGATAVVGPLSTTWQTGPARHEGGSPNVLGAVAVAAACAAIRENRGAVEAHESRLVARLVEGLRAIDGVETFSIFGDDADRAPVVAFTVEDVESSLVSAALSAEYGIGVRDGKFCAHLLVDALLADENADVTTAVRVSAGLATTTEHVDRLLAAVASLASQGPGVEYQQVEGRGWVPVDDQRETLVDLPW
ncbi:putative aminotransferase [Janibacter sp. HTCC2649]|uniref:aminotransferase class V-fold PLP-dependent enzyme n=1 Tax=Janibacter sp. HTCC2649 TaxID=313589 RepID=UPI000066EA78|nr:aminotransferase class V-fold PLP-dependent enzyme [Janibacter sp. HTCC2649]EAP98527.1 putative aminotransferase [Janibacter sp. HTCC2649]